MYFSWNNLNFILGFVGILACASGKKVSVKEDVFDSAVQDVQWFGPDSKIVLVQTAKGRLYRSVTGGAGEWVHITDYLSGGATTGTSSLITLERMYKSPADVSTVMVSGTRNHHFISNDGGSTFRRLRHRAGLHTFIFHRSRPGWALLSAWTSACEVSTTVKTRTSSRSNGEDVALGGGIENDKSPCSHNLFLTKDLGKTFSFIASYIVQFSWGDPSKNQQDRIYLTHFRRKSGDQPKLHMWTDLVDFAFTDDGGKTLNKVVDQGNKFLISHGFIFVARLKDAKTQTVKLMCSNDGGANFRQVRLPQEIDEKSYTILDTSEGTVMLHVQHGDGSSQNVGNVYVSDAQGVRFTLSLPNNVRSSSGECELDRVMSLDGVYLANFKDIQETSAQGVYSIVSAQADQAREADNMEKEAAQGSEVDKRRSAQAKGKEESITRTVISFDKGGAWSYLKPPPVDSRGEKIDCPPDKCWLHLHGLTNFQNYAPFYSVESAVGIIMGTGNVGPYLRFERDRTNTYLSRDGGLTWVEAHKGAYIYEFGDHGGLVVMADDVRRTKQVVFSWNEGESWYDFEFAGEPIDVDNIITGPNATSARFLLYGTRGDAGVMYQLDFEILGQPLCKGVWAADSVSSDYEIWTPTDGRVATEKCVLGRQTSYTRRKRASECFNGEKFERPTNRKNCACTEEDFECEMGFARKVGSRECKFANDGTLSAPDTCTSSDYFHAAGYRKVVGDTCEGGWQPPRVSVPCPANSKLSRGALSVLGSLFSLTAVMAAVTVLSRSEKCQRWFANYGFDAFGGVKYAAIGRMAPESAVDSVGMRFDTDFIDGDQDEFEVDAPQLMNYTTEGRDIVRRNMERSNVTVPRLQQPPGTTIGRQNDEEDLDLL